MRIIVSAGGTGGHIYPALAIIDKFIASDPNTEVLYIGTHNRMEKDIVPSKGIKYESLEIYGLSKYIIDDIRNIGLIRKAKKKCLKIMKEFKPDVVLGVGGYVTYPVISAAKKLHIKTFIHEQNSIPGKTNLVLSRNVDLVGVSFASTASYFKKAKKVVVTGNPCGESALQSKVMPKSKLGLSKTKKLIIIVAGSLGSATMNAKMKEYLRSIENEKYEVVYITGKNRYDEFIKDEKFPKNVFVLPFLDGLASLMKNASLVISRAGASTISEVLTLQIPTIFIPSPYVANNHQYYNALDLVNKKAALMIEEKDLNVDILKESINSILNDQVKITALKKAMSSFNMASSSDIIYNEIRKII